MTLYDCTSGPGRGAGIAAATEAVRSGLLVVLPTDTVYGIGADAFAPGAVRALLAAKGRGRNMPPPVLVDGPRRLPELVDELPEGAEALAERFWPGGLTIVVRHRPSLTWDIGDTGGTVGVRMPADPVALELLRETGPLAVSSANRHKAAPADTASQAVDQFGDLVATYLETGPCPGGVPSTVVSMVGERPLLLRAGAVSAERLREVLPGLDRPAARAPDDGAGVHSDRPAE